MVCLCLLWFRSYCGILKYLIQYNVPTILTRQLSRDPENLNSKAIHDKKCDQSKSTPSAPLSSAPMTAALLFAPELGADEMVRGGTTVGGELATGSDGGGKNEDVALQNHNQCPTYFWGGRQVNGDRT